MTELEKIKKWKVPIWHKDFGDPSKEIKLLQELCFFILDSGFKFNFNLEYIEEGYLCVNILKNKKYYAELQVVDINQKKIGIFFENGNEFYIYKKEEITNYL